MTARPDSFPLTGFIGPVALVTATIIRRRDEARLCGFYVQAVKRQSYLLLTRHTADTHRAAAQCARGHLSCRTDRTGVGHTQPPSQRWGLRQPGNPTRP